MFIGHFGIALAAKKAAPGTSLGTLILAAQFADAIWPIFLLLGLEEVRIAPGRTRMTPLDFVSYPYSHSLVALIAWALLLGGLYFVVRRQGSAAVVVAACVLSHWFLDAAAHGPDMPLFFHGPKVGLGIWNSMAGTLAVELGIFALGIYLYVVARPARDRIGIFAFWGLMVILAGGWLASAFGPPPPSVKALAYSSLGGWLLLALAIWGDRHRGSVRTAAESN